MIAIDPSSRPTATSVVDTLRRVADTRFQSTALEIEHEREALARERRAAERSVDQRAAALAARASGLEATASEIATRERKLREREASVAADRQRVAAAEQPAPTYWKHTDLSKLHFSLQESRFMKDKFERLLHSTVKTAGCQGGCGGGRGIGTGVHVTRVERIENTNLWKNYARKKASMAELNRRGSAPHALQPAAGSSEVVDASLNELWLFHGTQPDTAKVIAK
jgi:hypothetical protein